MVGPKILLALKYPISRTPLSSETGTVYKNIEFNAV
jgi:hypothetical protein